MEAVAVEVGPVLARQAVAVRPCLVPLVVAAAVGVQGEQTAWADRVGVRHSESLYIRLTLLSFPLSVRIQIYLGIGGSGGNGGNGGVGGVGGLGAPGGAAGSIGSAPAGRGAASGNGGHGGGGGGGAGGLSIGIAANFQSALYENENDLVRVQAWQVCRVGGPVIGQFRR